ncbi:MAG: TonB-dependent receptor plug domain-containing protein [Bacteroidota bacterium]
MNRLWILALFSIIATQFSFSQDVIIRGTLIEKSNGEAIISQKVKLLRNDSTVITGAFTDENGFFSIPRVPRGKLIIKIESEIYSNTIYPIDVIDARGILNFRFEMKKVGGVKVFDEFVVTAAEKQKKNEVLTGTFKLDPKMISAIPNTTAESDLIGSVSVVPGVVTTGDQGGQLYVRGGTPIQNKTILDGMTIYNPFHTIGFFSIFETELIKNVDVFTGGFDAQYGGRISSIMDVSYRDGDRVSFGGKVSTSPFLAKLVLEGPLQKTKDGKPGVGSYIFSAKHSLLDYTSKYLYPRINDGNGLPFNFTDIYGKVTFNGNGGSKFSAFGFYNLDSVNYNVADLNWNAAGLGINFVLVPNTSPVIIKGHVNGSNYSTTFAENNLQPRTSKIGGFDLGFDFIYFLPNESELNYGFNLNGFNTEFKTYNELQRKIELFNFTTEIGAYINVRQKFGEKWVVQPSFRLQVYSSLGTISPEPRIGIKYNATDKFRLKLSGGRFSQNFTSASSDKDIVNLFNGLLSAPTNVQETFINEFQNQRNTKNGLQYAWHAILGGEYDFGKRVTLNLEGYYKYFSQLSNINQNKLYDDVAEFSQIDDVFKKDFILESGQTYGVDLLVKYKYKGLFIWTGYSYSYSTRWDGFVNYFPVFDRRHNVNIVSSYSFGKNKSWEINGRWNLGSGLPFTPTAGYYQNENFFTGVTSEYETNNAQTITTLLGEFNSQRLPFYHRLDITIKKRFTFRNQSELELVGSLTNVYNRRNIFYVNRVTNEEIYQFPFLPSFGLSYNF